MNIKKIISLLLIFVLCFSFSACGGETPTSSADASSVDSSSVSSNTDETASVEESGPILYKVTDSKGNVIWLFGSIHAGREDYYPLPSYVNEAFNNAESLAVEADIVEFEKDMDLQVSAMTELVYYDGSTIKDHISKDLYKRSVDVLKHYKSYFQALDMYCPAFWSSLIESSMINELGGDVALGIDRHFLDKAKKAKKEIVEIESAKFQYKIMGDFDDDIQTMLLESALQMYENKDEAAAELKKMMDLWVSGNESEFAEYLNSSDGELTDEEKQIYDKYNKIMVTDRNIAMADFAKEALSDGEETFICVGSAHIIGDGALAKLLEQEGYTVERVVK